MSDPNKQSTSARLIAVDKVEGKPVFDRARERLGTVKDVFIDKRSGQVEYVSLAFGGVMGMGEKYHPLPWSVLDYDVDKDGFVIDLDKDALEGSPGYESARLTGDDYGWGDEVADYYAGIGVARTTGVYGSAPGFRA